MADAKSTIREWLIAVIAAVAISIVVRYYFFAPYEVNGESMMPTLHSEELLIVNKWIYSVGEPKYGEIIVFHSNEGRDFIKRVIGLPGDRIEIIQGKVYRNGKEISEPYIKNKMDPLSNHQEMVVPKGKVYVLGDNRNNSTDSRSIGPVDESKIVGRAELVVMPFEQMHFLHP